MISFQRRVHEWMLKCFGAKIASDLTERNHRFLEEALELVQSLGCTSSEAVQLVRYARLLAHKWHIGAVTVRNTQEGRNYTTYIGPDSPADGRTES